MMYINRIGQKLPLTLLTPVIIVGSIFVALPSKAATLITVSQIGLTLDNFNQFPRGVAVINDVKATAIAEQGIAQNQIDRDTIFFADPPTVFANAFLNTLSLGTGSQYVFRTDLSSALLGRFAIAAGNVFQFTVEGSLSLDNFVATWPVGNASTFGSLSLGLFDRVTQRSWPLFNISGFINTNPFPKLNKDSFRADINPNFVLTRYDQQLSLAQEGQETIRVDFAGVFQQFFEQETELDVIAVVQSCTGGSNLVEICRKVPEPSHRFALIILVSAWGSWHLFSRIMKQIV